MTSADEIAARYDQNAERYDDVTRFNRDAATRLVASLPGRPYGTVLDVGCGTGSAAMAMIGRFHVHTVTGVDVSAQMLAQMRVKLDAHPDVRADLHVADVLAMPVSDAAYDCVLSGMALHWFRDRAAAIGAMGRALAPGGVLGLVAPGPGHDHEYTEVLRSLRPSVPSAVIDVFSTAQVFPDEVEELLVGAGLTPLDVWVERRIAAGPAGALHGPHHRRRQPRVESDHGSRRGRSDGRAHHRSRRAGGGTPRL